jgi:hypothetical protein
MRILRGHWFPVLCGTPLKVVTRGAIKHCLAEWLAAGSRSKTVQARLHVLRACFTAAVEDGLIPGSPAARLGRFATQSAENTRIIERFLPTRSPDASRKCERESPESPPGPADTRSDRPSDRWSTYAAEGRPRLPQAGDVGAAHLGEPEEVTR